MAKDWKDRLGVVYSTNQDYEYDTGKIEDPETLPANQQILKVAIDKKHRKGKVVTLVNGFVGTDDDLKDLSKILKTKCGVGGSAKEGTIILQGAWLDKVKTILNDLGYQVK